MTRDQTDQERGAGVFSMAMGLTMFLLLLTFSVNLLYNLYTTSVISSLAIEAARDVAEFDGNEPEDGIGAAKAEFESRVGDATMFELRVENDGALGQIVVADITWESRSLFPAFSDARAFGVIDRTFTVRVEQQQDVS